MTETVKKKRGPKPKPKNVTNEVLVPVPKKRGRKPKNKSIEVKDPNKLPKKRGRKPKEVIVNVNKNIINDEPIILHLPIKSNYNNDIYIPKPFIDIDKFNSKYKNIINQPIDENIKTNVKV